MLLALLPFNKAKKMAQDTESDGKHEECRRSLESFSSAAISLSKVGASLAFNQKILALIWLPLPNVIKIILYFAMWTLRFRQTGF